MARTDQDLKQVAVGAATFAVLCWLGWHLVSWVATTFLSLEKDVAKAIVAAAGAILVASITAFVSQRANKLRDIAESHRPAKTENYVRFMDLLVDKLKKAHDGSNQAGVGDEMSGKELDQFFTFKRDLVVWADPRVIQEFLKFEASSSVGGKGILLTVDSLLRAMRADLGNKNAGLRSGDLVKLFLKHEDHHKL